MLLWKIKQSNNILISNVFRIEKKKKKKKVEIKCMQETGKYERKSLNTLWYTSSLTHDIMSKIY